MRNVLQIVALLSMFADSMVLCASEHSSATRCATSAVVAKASEFRFDASCTVRCNSGSCQQVCPGGLVYAFDAGSARIQAEARLRAEAARQGTVVEGTVNISVTLTKW